MDAYHYVDIFATKGIEYLLIIGFLVVLPFAWRFLNQTREQGRTNRQTRG